MVLKSGLEAVPTDDLLSSVSFTRMASEESPREVFSLSSSPPVAPLLQAA
jgi:hypothetical protein